MLFLIRLFNHKTTVRCFNIPKPKCCNLDNLAARAACEQWLVLDYGFYFFSRKKVDFCYLFIYLNYDSYFPTNV